MTEGDQDSLAEDVHADIRMICEQAAEAGRDEITGHQIIDALSASWDRLRVGRYELWEQ